MLNSRAEQSIFELTRTPKQIAALRDICECWHTGPEQFWPFESVVDALSRPGSLVFFIADSAESDSWSGAALIDLGPYSADLLYIYVRPERRRIGLSGQMMTKIFETLRAKQQIEALFLEVRTSNTAAQKLYHGLGMALIGTRKHYYANGEDALIFKIELNTSADDVLTLPEGRK